MRLSRQLHLWIGLLSTVFILIEAVTGFFMLEPGLLGGNGSPPSHMARQAITEGGAAQTGTTDSTDSAEGSMIQRPAGKEGGGGMMGLIKNLHKGRVGNVDLTLFMEITAVCMIALCITGIVLSIRILSAQRKSRLKKKAAAISVQG